VIDLVAWGPSGVSLKSRRHGGGVVKKIKKTSMVGSLLGTHDALARSL